MSKIFECQRFCSEFFGVGGLFICEGVKVLEPYATGAQILRVEVNFGLRSSSVSTAYPAAWKLSSFQD